MASTIELVKTVRRCVSVNSGAAEIESRLRTYDSLIAFVQHVADLNPDEPLGDDARALLARCAL